MRLEQPLIRPSSLTIVSSSIPSLNRQIISNAISTSFIHPDLHGKLVEYREVQGYESNRFLSYFPQLIVLHGGVSTGFHHVSDPLPLELRRLYRIKASTHHGIGATVKTHISIREVPADVQSLNKGDVFVLDLGSRVLQYNTRESSGKERFLAADFVRGITDSRPGRCEPTVYGMIHRSLPHLTS